MSQPRSRLRVAAALAACAAIMVAAAGSARASVISSTPTLPVLGGTYTSLTGAGCFPAVLPAGVCISPGAFTLTSLISSTFDADSQDIKANVSYAGTLTTLGGTPIGPVNLTGIMVQDVLGRLSDTATGSWTTNLLVLSLIGLVGPNTLSLSLDSSNPSAGQTSITPLDDGLFRIDSFFDIFVDLALQPRDATQPPLHTTRGPIHAELVPEPSSLALLVGGLAALASRRQFFNRNRRPGGLPAS